MDFSDRLAPLLRTSIGLFQKHYKHAVRSLVVSKTCQFLVPQVRILGFSFHFLECDFVGSGHLVFGFLVQQNPSGCWGSIALVEVPASTEPCGPRINLTFRWIKVKAKLRFGAAQPGVKSVFGRFSTGLLGVRSSCIFCS